MRQDTSSPRKSQRDLQGWILSLLVLIPLGSCPAAESVAPLSGVSAPFLDVTVSAPVPGIISARRLNFVSCPNVSSSIGATMLYSVFQ